MAPALPDRTPHAPQQQQQQQPGGGDPRMAAHNLNTDPSLSYNGTANNGLFGYSNGVLGLNAPPAGNSSGHATRPLFDRFMTDDVQEIKAYTRIIEEQNQRVTFLEQTNRGLEDRLERECKDRKQLEDTLEREERRWAEERHRLQEELDRQEGLVVAEKDKLVRLQEHFKASAQHIQHLQKQKYDKKNPQKPHIRSMRSMNNTQQHLPPRAAIANQRAAFESPHDLIFSQVPEYNQTKNVMSLLTDFFGI